ncbi:archease [Elusimicrobiota bacterium]
MDDKPKNHAPNIPAQGNRAPHGRPYPRRRRYPRANPNYTPKGPASDSPVSGNRAPNTPAPGNRTPHGHTHSYGKQYTRTDPNVKPKNPASDSPISGNRAPHGRPYPRRRRYPRANPNYTPKGPASDSPVSGNRAPHGHVHPRRERYPRANPNYRPKSPAPGLSASENRAQHEHVAFHEKQHSHTSLNYKLENHASDIAVSITAKSMPMLFRNAITACEDILLPQNTASDRAGKYHSFSIAMNAVSLEQLYVIWLNEILYWTQTKGFICSKLRLQLNTQIYNLKVQAQGFLHKKLPLKREIKSATFNELSITHYRGKFQAHVVFDV